MMEVIIASAVRTAIGNFGGSLSGIPVTQLGKVVVGESIKRAGIPFNLVDQVILGNVLQAGCGQGTARQASVFAGVPVEVPAFTINNLCGSGLRAINLAAALILCGEAEIIVAGGMENMSAAPYMLRKARWGYRLGDGTVEDLIIKDGLWEAFNDYHMGVTAENLAEKYGISRREQDEYAASSQQKASAAIKELKFTAEIVPITIQNKKGQDQVYFQDEFPREGVSVESLSKLKSAFKKDGTVTAGNSSGINDGAAALVIMSKEKALKLGVKPLARIVSSASAGVDPRIMGIGPVPATKKALAKSRLSLTDIQLIEANEAFAAQTLAVSRELGWDMTRVNVNGGAIALGHPIGASGARILVSLIHEMVKRDLEFGLATLCVGGGMGVATIIQRL